MKIFGQILAALALVAGTIAGVGLLIFLLAAMNALVVSQMWEWFITPTFNIAVPSLAAIYGLMLLIGFFKNTTKKDEEQTMSDVISSAIAKAAVVLGFGWVVHTFFM